MRPALRVLSLLAVFGCASDPDNKVAPGHEGAPGVERFLVCAPNTVIALPAELQDAAKLLREQVDAYLKFQGRQVQWLDLFDSKRLWVEAINTAKQQTGSVDATPAFFARALDELYEFDAIVMPSIFLHKSRAHDGYASWDGVHRRMELVNAPRMPGARAQSTLAQGVAYGGISGDVFVTSVHVLVFSRAGERVFEGRGGVGFVHDVHIKELSWQFQPRDPSRDIDALREGIAIAFDPYLTAPEE